MADRDTVIVGIGHSSLHPNATSQKLVNPGLLKLAKQDSGYDYKRNVITEYFYCRGLALMICEELSKLGLKGVTSNRYKDSDINILKNYLSCEDTKNMLIADKIQNYKDFKENQNKYAEKIDIEKYFYICHLHRCYLIFP